MKDCNQCGKCCIKYGGSDLAVTQEEIDLWEIFNPDIFAYVKDNEIWFDPASGVALEQCPFLEIIPDGNDPASVHPPTDKSHRYTCGIYLNRPEDCRQYPSLITEMIRDECEMIETVDIDQPEKAQHKLNALR